MRKRILVLLFISCTLVLMSQEKTSFVSLKAGASIPVGKYAAKNLDYGCFTTTGISFGLEGAWFFMPWLGVGGQYNLNFHPVDVGVLGWEKVQNDPFLVDVTIRSEAYRTMTFAIGLYGRWDIVKNLSLNGKVLGGAMMAQSPYQLYKPTYFLVQPKWFEITPSRDWNAAIIAGLGFQYDVSHCVGLKIDADYSYSKMVFSFSTGGGVRYEYRDISYINLSFGVVLNL